jgi:hypothetical protein
VELLDAASKPVFRVRLIAESVGARAVAYCAETRDRLFARDIPISDRILRGIPDDFTNECTRCLQVSQLREMALRSSTVAPLT